jgi:uncharacterized membrane protein HdeD (DUF308 family)
MSDPIAQAAKQGGGSTTILGVVTIILGLLAMSAPMFAGASVAIMVAIILVAAGVARMVWAFRADSFCQGLLKLAIGGITLLAGILMLARPLFALGTLTIFLAAFFIVDGIFEIIAAFQVKPVEGWGWLLSGGIVSLLLGIMIWRQFPVSGTWAIGILVGVKLLFAGMEMVYLGSTVREVGRVAEG